eukprot:gene2958-biopygen17118
MRPGRVRFFKFYRAGRVRDASAVSPSGAVLTTPPPGDNDTPVHTDLRPGCAIPAFLGRYHCGILCVWSPGVGVGVGMGNPPPPPPPPPRRSLPTPTPPPPPPPPPPRRSLPTPTPPPPPPPPPPSPSPPPSHRHHRQDCGPRRGVGRAQVQAGGDQLVEGLPILRA